MAKTRIIHDKITIRDLPLPVSNWEIKQVFEEEGVKFVSKIKYSVGRDLDGSTVTNYRNGDRFAYVEKMDTMIKRI